MVEQNREIGQITPEELDQRTKMIAIINHVVPFQNLSATNKEEIVDLL